MGAPIPLRRGDCFVIGFEDPLPHFQSQFLAAQEGMEEVITPPAEVIRTPGMEATFVDNNISSVKSRHTPFQQFTQFLRKNLLADRNRNVKNPNSKSRNNKNRNIKNRNNKNRNKTRNKTVNHPVTLYISSENFYGSSEEEIRELLKDQNESSDSAFHAHRSHSSSHSGAHSGSHSHRGSHSGAHSGAHSGTHSASHYTLLDDPSQPFFFSNPFRSWQERWDYSLESPFVDQLRPDVGQILVFRRRELDEGEGDEEVEEGEGDVAD